MKILTQAGLIFLIFLSTVMCQESEMVTMSSDSAANTSYIAGGYSWLQGYKFELGINKGSTASFAINFSENDRWSSHRHQLMCGIMGRAFLRKPVEGKVLPYFGIEWGANFGDLIKMDSFFQFNLGSLLHFTSGICLRPEMSLSFTSKYLYGDDIFILGGGKTETVNENVTRLNATLFLELDAAKIFK